MKTMRPQQRCKLCLALGIMTLMISGMAPSSPGDDYLYVTSAVVGMVRRPVSQGFTLMAPPLRTDMQFGANFGEALAQPMTGSDAGPGLGADEVYVLEPNGTWRVLYLDASNVWKEADGTNSVYELAPGQGFYVKHTSETVQPSVTGQVGNDGTRTNLVRAGWNILGLSEGRSVDLKQVFSNLRQVEGEEEGPVGNAYEEAADTIIMPQADGTWRRLFYIQGWGAPYDGNWFDLSTFMIYTNKLQPGDAFFYFRQDSGGDACLVF